MPGFPPLPNVVVRDLETLMDAWAYMLATDSRTSAVDWILGDVGMGSPSSIPFGYISQVSESIMWYSAAGGGSGGLAAGLDDWDIPIVFTIAHEPHRYIAPINATPPNTSPFSPANLGLAPPYQEQPGWRLSLQITQHVKQVLRTNVTVGGAATDTRVIESRFVLLSIQDQLFRCTRMTIATQQRRIRGN